MDSLCALYKYKIRCRRWYKYFFYHYIHLAVANSWLLYIRDFKLSQATGKSLILRKFISSVACTLQRANKPQFCSTKRARLSLTQDIRYDNIGHLLVWADKRQRCKLCVKNNPWIMSSKCEISLCITRERNCFLEFHKQ